MDIDNPAARLWALLSQAQSYEEKQASRLTVWTKVLGPEVPVAQGIAEVAALLVDLQRVVSRVDNPAITALYEHYAPEWRRAVLSPGAAWNTSSLGMVDTGALTSLGGLASMLSAMGSEGTVPAEEETAGLREAVQSALDEVRDEASLPQQIRQLLVARLHDMLWAIDHVRVVGPEGVKAAAERLVGVVAFSPEVRTQGPIVTKTMIVVRRVWAAFTFAGQATEAIEGWDKVIDMLPPP